MSEIILASKSSHRCDLLTRAGITFTVQPANIDERSIEAPILEAGLGGADVAEILSVSKASEVSNRNVDAYVIGCDQTLSLKDELLHKPKDMDEARRRLLALSGKTHELNSGLSIVRNGETLWSYVEVSRIEFRKLDPGFIGRHLAAAGDKILSSVGAYQIEGIGVQLFKNIDGDFFSIMGLPLLPLLAKLREFELVDN